MAYGALDRSCWRTADDRSLIYFAERSRKPNRNWRVRCLCLLSSIEPFCLFIQLNMIFYTNILNSRLTFITTVKTGIVVKHILESTRKNKYVAKFKTAYNNPDNNIREKMNHIIKDIVEDNPETYDLQKTI